MRWHECFLAPCVSGKKLAMIDKNPRIEFAALSACSMFWRRRRCQPHEPAPRRSYRHCREMVQQVQARLQQQGTYRGSIDGQWSRATEAAVRSYPQQHYVNATGQLATATLASLNLGSKQISVNTPPTIRPFSVLAAPTTRRSMRTRRRTSTYRLTIRPSRTPAPDPDSAGDAHPNRPLRDRRELHTPDCGRLPKATNLPCLTALFTNV
jgi:Putative peptidoglycan binding domain